MDEYSRLSLNVGDDEPHSGKAMNRYMLIGCTLTIVTVPGDPEIASASESLRFARLQNLRDSLDERKAKRDAGSKSGRAAESGVSQVGKNNRFILVIPEDITKSIICPELRVAVDAGSRRTSSTLARAFRIVSESQDGHANWPAVASAPSGL